MPDEEKIRREGIRLLEEYSVMLKDIPEGEETHYVTELRNKMRDDGKPVKKKEFREKLRRIAPRWEENYVVAEKGR